MKWMSLLAILLTVGMTSVSGQQKYYVNNKKAIAIFEEGCEYYNWNKFEAALERFQMALKVEPKFIDSYFAMADIYRESKEFEKQLAVLEKGIAIDSTYYPMAYYSAGVALCNMGKADESLDFFDLYKRFANPRRMRKDTDKWIAHAKFVKNLYDHPVPYNPRPVLKLASPFDVYWPSLNLDGSELAVTVLTPKNYDMFRKQPDLPKNSAFYQEDLYVTQKDEYGEWGDMIDMSDINTRIANEGAQALTPDGSTMFLTICGRQDSKGSCDIYVSRRTKTGWTAPRNVGEPVNSSQWESQPCLSADGQTLYFVSGRGGGVGRHDIWKAKIESYRADGMPVFGNVENLGPNINTVGDESSPFIHADNKTLFFSSDTWEGIGGLDVFVSKRDNEFSEWQKPENIGYPINTAYDESGLIVDTKGTTGYFSIDAKQSDGSTKRELMCFDIPVQHRPSPVLFLKGNVYDKETHEPLDAKLELLDYAGNLVTRSATRPSDGNYLLNLPLGKKYALIAMSDNHLYHSETITVPDSLGEADSIRQDMLLAPIKIGAVVVLKNVFFETNSSELKEESKIELMKLVQLMIHNQKLNIEIGGHTDKVGSEVLNAKLSNSRASSTKQFLVDNGIDEKRIKTSGYGSKKPIGDNNTEEGRALNRRIEAKIIE